MHNIQIKAVQHFVSRVLKHTYKGVFISLLAIFLFYLPLPGQGLDNNSIKYTNYNVADGLPNQRVNCTFQDSRGFLWVATNGGFSRFDGKTFVNYSTENFDVSFQNITEIYEDENAILWLVETINDNSLSKKRILIFNSDTETLGFYKEVQSIASTPDKQIVLGTKTGELILCNGQKQHVIYTSGERNPIIQVVATTKHYWLNEGNKMSLINKNGELVQEWSSSHKFILLGNKGEDIYVREVFLSSNNDLKDRILFYKVDDIIPNAALINKSNAALTINENWEYFSKEEKFVVYDEAIGLSLFEETGEDIYRVDSLKVRHVYMDSNGLLWISSTSGLHEIQITPSKFSSFLHKEAPLDFSMRGMVANGDSLYCNTYDGNVIYDLRTSEIVKRLPENDIEFGLAIIKASDGCLYTGGTGTALQQICDNGTQENFFYPKNTTTAPRDYWAIFEDSRQEIWLGTNQGLSYLDKANSLIEPFKKYNQFTELSRTIVFDIVETNTAYWIAAEAGLFKLESDKGITSWFHSGEPTPNSGYLPADVIFDIYEDEDGFLWLTTFGSGLIRFNPQDETYKQITVKEGLAHNVTNDILEDDYENLWISTNNGIVRLNRRSGELMNFDKSDGLHMDEFNKKSSAKLDDGRLAFGGLNGFVVFHPKDFLKTEDKGLKNNLRITQVIIDEEVKNSIDTTEPITLVDTKTDITFDLHLLDFVNNEPATYEWKWKNSGSEFETLSQGRLHLRELPSGKSTLIFRAKSAKGVTALNELEVNFIAPRSFFALQLILGLSAMLGLFFLYKKQKSKKEKEANEVKSIVKKKETTAKIVEAKKEEKKIDVLENTDAKPVVARSLNDQKWLDVLTVAIQHHENIGQFSVEDMAKEVNLSSRQLNRKIKQLTGITPNQFLRDIKLKKAKTLLESGAVSTVAETSLAVGFEKPDYFSRLFQEKYGVRPVTYFDKKK